jgi:hypothetical protein
MFSLNRLIRYVIILLISSIIEAVGYFFVLEQRFLSLWVLMYFIYELLHYISLYNDKMTVNRCFDVYHHITYTITPAIPYMVYIVLKHDKFAMGLLSCVFGLIIKIHARLLMRRMTYDPEMPISTV